MINKSSGMAVYKQIEQAIRTGIERGVYPVGQKLPSEDELGAEFGASRGTIRQAVSELVSRGIVKRVHGSGTYVCEPGNEYVIETDHFISFLDKLENAGVPIETIAAGKQVVDSCGLPDEPFPGQPRLYEIRRVRKKDGKPVMLSLDYIPLDLAPGIEQKYHDEKSVYDFLEQQYALRVSQVKRVFHAVPAAAEVARALCLKTGEPVFYIVQQAFDQYGRCVDCASLYVVSAEMHFSVLSRR